jgi:hypothetical protein
MPTVAKHLPMSRSLIFPPAVQSSTSLQMPNGLRLDGNGGDGSRDEGSVG